MVFLRFCYWQGPPVRRKQGLDQAAHPWIARMLILDRPCMYFAPRITHPSHCGRLPQHQNDCVCIASGWRPAAGASADARARRDGTYFLSLEHGTDDAGGEVPGPELQDDLSESLAERVVDRIPFHATAYLRDRAMRPLFRGCICS